MKNTILLFATIFLFSGFIFAQNHLLRGVVKLKSSGSMPLAEVKISSFGAQSIYSNEDGMFELQFPNKNPGNRVRLIVNKPGFEVINADQVENCLLRSDADDLVVIVMAQEGERDQEAIRHYNIMVDYEDVKYKKQVADLQAKIDEQNTSGGEMETLKEQLYQLEVDRDQWRRKAEQLAPQLASIDLDRTSDIVRRAYKFFNEGKVLEAIQVLEDEELAKNLEQAVIKNTVAKDRLVAAKASLDMCVESYLVKARFCITNKEYETALQCYLTSFNADSSSLENTEEVLDFVQSMNRQDLAIGIIKTSLRQPIDVEQRWKLLNKLGANFTTNKDYVLADSVLTEALSLQNEKASISELDKKSLVLNTIRTRASLYLHTKNGNAIEELEKSVSLIEELMPLDSSKYLVIRAKTYSDLAVALESAGQYKEAYAMHLKTIASGENLVVSEDDYEDDFATHLSNLGVFLTRMRKYDDAETAYLRSLKIKKLLTQKNSAQHEPSFANTYMNLANLYGRTRQFDKAKAAYDTISLIFEKLAFKNPNQFEDGFGRVKMNQGNILRDLREYREAQKAYLRSLEIRKRWYAKAERRFATQLSSTYQNLGLLYRNMEAYDKSEDAHRLSIEYHPENANDSLRAASPAIAGLRMDFGNLYKTNYQIEKSDSLYQLSALAYSKQIELGNERYKYNLCVTLINHSELFAIGLEKYWQEIFQVKGQQTLSLANDALSKLSDRNQQRFSGYLAKYDSIFKMYSPNDLLIREALLDISESSPDSSALSSEAILGQQTYLDEVEKLMDEHPSSAFLKAKKADGLSYLWWIYTVQEQPEKAYASIKSAREVTPKNPDLVARELVSRALSQNQTLIDEVLEDEAWKSCSDCVQRYRAILDKLSTTNASIDTNYLQSVLK